MDFNWHMFNMSLMLVAIPFGAILVVGYQSKKSNINYRYLGLLAVAFLGYMYVISAGLISSDTVRILGLIGASGVLYTLYLNKKGK